jgi:A/G-specific adenine glycosylase
VSRGASNVAQPDAPPWKRLVRARGFRRRLVGWFGREARAVPWRGTTDPYAVWVAEIALQQTRVDQGTPYIERFLRRFPTVRALAAADLDEVLKLWEGLGYYARARNLHAAARLIVGERGGVLPSSIEELRLLPGIGRYTAGAIASIAFDAPVPVLDGNVKRVLARVLDYAASIDASEADALFWDAIGALVRGPAPGDLNQAMMELGAQVCTPRVPDCGRCPIASYCAARANGTVGARPVRRAKARVPHHEVVVAAIHKRGRYLLGKRPEGGLLGGLWEFPGGKVERGENHAQALRREAREELGVRVDVGGLVATVEHAYSHFRVTLHVYRCAHRSGTPTARVHTRLRWTAPAEFARLAFPKANHKFLHLL